MRTGYWAFDRLGGPEVLERREGTLAPPGPGEVRVRHVAVGLNFTDVNLRRGEHPEPVMFPARIGQEAAGVVDAVGDGVPDVAPGDRVVYATRPPGAYAEARVLAAARLVPVPDELPLATAAAGLLKGMTAEYLSHRCYPVAAGEYAVVYAAAGGVGRLLCRWLAHKGVRVIGVVGARTKIAAAEAAGCHAVLVLGEDDVADGVRDVTGGAMADVVYDSLGALSFEASLASLRRRGTLVAFGSASGPIPPTAPLVLGARGSLYLTWPRIGDYTASREELLAGAARVFAAHRDGVVDLTPSHRFAFADAVAAHAALEARRTTGAAILEVADEQALRAPLAAPALSR